MKKILKVGFTYLNRFNKKVKIIKQLDYSRFLGDNNIEYGIVGVAINKGASWDLISYDEGFPKLVVKTNIPVKIVYLNNKFEFEYEEKEIIIEYIKRILTSENKYLYEIHYQNENNENLNPSNIDNKLSSMILKRNKNFHPEELFYDNNNICKIDSLNIKWNLY